MQETSSQPLSMIYFTKLILNVYHPYIQHYPNIVIDNWFSIDNNLIENNLILQFPTRHDSRDRILLIISLLYTSKTY